MRSETVLKIIAVYSLLAIVFFLIIIPSGMDDKYRAASYMLLTLIILWVIMGGVLMYVFRRPFRALVSHISWGWKTKFILLCILFALTEEAITVAITNFAPLYGVAVGEAFLTVSTNYLVVVLLHSVIVFVPMFVCWAWLLGRYDFRPAQVFLLFGLTGLFAEGLLSPLSLFMGFWVFVYGLMVVLPAFSITEKRKVRQLRFYHYFLALFLPLVCALPVVIFVTVVREALGIIFFSL